MKKIAKFSRVSFEQFKSAFDSECPGIDEDIIRGYYDRIKLPKRATKGSAGYDFSVPFNVVVKPGMSVKIPTGINCMMDDNWVLKVYPRSGLGFKYRLRLNNTVGIIDSDYYYSDNEGHIMIKISNEGDMPVTINEGDRFAQGVFLEYGITVDDDADGVRNGGFGSTNN